MSETHFVVERLNWRRIRDWQNPNNNQFFKLPGSRRVQSFATRDEAEAFLQVEEAKARAVVNPFNTGLRAPQDQTTMLPAIYHDWLLDHGISPPDGNWAEWYAANVKQWSPDQLAALWEPLDQVRFYQIREQPKANVAYAVVRSIWDYNDEWFYPGDEGGEVTTVYRSRERALQECAVLNEEDRLNWEQITGEYADDEIGHRQMDMQDRLFPDQSPFEPLREPPRQNEEDWGMWAPSEIPFCEVIEIEIGESS